MDKNAESLQREAERHPDDALVWLRLGGALAARAREHDDAFDRVAALAALHHAVAIADPGELLARAAVALAEAGDLDGACEGLRRAGPTVAGHGRVARLLVDAGRAAEALALLEPAAAAVPDDDELRLVLAMAHAGSGTPDAALAQLAVVVGRRPDHLGGHLLRAGILATMGRTAECITAWQTVARLSPDDPQAMTGLAVALAAAGRYDEALEHLFQVVQEDSSSAAAYLNLAIVLREAGRLEEAEWAVRRAIDLQPGAVQAHYDLGLVLEAAGRLPEAAQAFREAMPSGGAAVGIVLALARVLERTGRTDAAIEALASASAEPTRDAAAQRDLAEALAALRLRGLPAHGAFAGSLSAFSIWQLLELVQNHRSSGRLELVLPGAPTEIFVRQGLLVRVTSPGAPRLIDEILAVQGANPRLQSALATQRSASDASVVRTLVRLNLVDAATVRRALERQIEVTLERIMDRVDGSFAFHQEAFDPSPLDVELDVRFVLLEIARARDAAAEN